MGQWRQIPVLWILIMGSCWVGLALESVFIRDWPFWISGMGFVGGVLSEVLWRSKIHTRIKEVGWNPGLVIYLGVFFLTVGVAWCGLWGQWAFGGDVNEQGLLVFFSAVLVMTLVVCLTFKIEQRKRDWPVWSFWLALTISIYPVWQGLVFGANYLAWASIRVACAQGGMALAFMSGLLWVVWYMERRSRQLQLARHADSQKVLGQVGPLEAMSHSVAIPVTKPWNPFDQDAWYYGRRRQKLKQSFNAIFSYTIIFACMVMLILGLSGCREIYEMPAGGGEELLGLAGVLKKNRLA